MEGRCDGGEGDIRGPLISGGGLGMLKFASPEGHPKAVGVCVVDGVEDETVLEGLEVGCCGGMG